MRTIRLEGKQYDATTQMVDAIAWATNRRGRNAWKHDVNVIYPIFDYLMQHNVEMLESYRGHGKHGRIRYTLKKLVEARYAEATPNESGKPYLTFKFKDDVDLNGHTPRFKTDPQPEPAIHTTTIPANVNYGVAVSPLDVEYVPLPPAPKALRYKAVEVNGMLDTWAEREPESYAVWAETLIERLGALYG